MNINEIIEKLKDILSTEHGDKKIFDKDVAAALGMSKESLSHLKKKNGIPYEQVSKFCASRKISINWVLYDQMPRSLEEEIHRRVMILARYLSYTISKLHLNPTTFYFKIRYEYGIKNSQSITVNRLFNEHFMIELAQSMIQQLDIHPDFKIHYIAISASNFADSHNLKTFCLMEYDKDVKFAALNEKLLKVRDKYGVDIVRYGRECEVG